MTCYRVFKDKLYLTYHVLNGNLDFKVKFKRKDKESNPRPLGLRSGALKMRLKNEELGKNQITALKYAQISHIDW